MGRCVICGAEITTGGCPNCNRTYYTYKWNPNIKKEVYPFMCPVCNGTGKVSRPPHIAGDVPAWSDNQTGPYACPACVGTGIVWGPPY